MTALELMDRLGGEFVMNRIRVHIEGKVAIIAQLEGQDWILTDLGISLANLHSNLAAGEVVQTIARVTETPVVESAPQHDDIAIELDIEPTPEQ
jgi:hypothetical protein